ESGDGCSASCQFEPVAFRITQIALRDPHAWVDACAILPCEDATDTTALFGPAMSVNGQIATAIRSDTRPQDGYLDLSALLIFGGLSANASSLPMQVIPSGDCVAQAPIACRPHVGAPILPTTAHSQLSGPCLGVLENTVLPYSPVVTVPSGPCFVSD